MIFEHIGDNRSGKTATMAIFAYVAHKNGQTVYCNCPDDEHILNFPHQDIDPYQMLERDLFNSYVMTDQAEQALDARRAMKTEMLETSYFGYQATKRLVDWHYDTVRHKNIDPRIRLNPHFYIKTVRIPKNPNEQLKAIKILSQSRYSTKTKTHYIINPERFYKIYNHLVMIRPKKVTPYEGRMP